MRIPRRRRAECVPVPGGAQRRRAAVLLVAVGLAACAPDGALVDEVEALRAEVEERREVQRAHEERIDALEEVLATLDPASDPASERADLRARIEATDEELMRVFDGLAVLEEDLAALASDATATTEELATGLSDARASLSALQGGVEAVRGDLELLDTLYETLLERLDRLDVRVSRLGG